MTEKIITVEKALLGQQIGILSKKEMHLIAGKLAKILEIHRDDIEDS
jgi:mRNA-degrading endonuclease toxin of MazEF toxin-antitoxin module